MSANDVPGWRDAHVRDLAGALRARGHDVTVHHRRHAEDDELYLGDFVDELRTEWAGSLPDLVHAHFWRSGLAALLAAQPFGVPVVQSFHGFGQRVDVERLVGRQAALVLAGGEDELLDLTAANVPRPRIGLVARGVDVDLFHPYGRTAPRTALRRVVTVVDPLLDNGVADLVAALPRLPDVELVVAGARAGDVDRLGRWARKLGVEDRVQLIGPVAREDLPALLRSADVVACVPSRPSWDALPLEAMACGVPVIATAVGGLTDAVIDGVTGVLVPPRDLKRLVRTLRLVLDDTTLRTACGIAAVDRVHARHTWPDVATGMERLYRGLLDPPAPAQRRRSGRAEAGTGEVARS
ncbi:glycosyltransferase [Lentzea sp.]|uniref:glycosyltransferase n=1 Tax=Lentzea sp. TaxID=56099 RepID=UPI002C2DC976|nr:glycosyltransferase [Lentzea sp.]HUQ55049.1 glycosyltransferase [Lentzea sp.]